MSLYVLEGNKEEVVFTGGLSPTEYLLKESGLPIDPKDYRNWFIEEIKANIDGISNQFLFVHRDNVDGSSEEASNDSNTGTLQGTSYSSAFRLPQALINFGTWLATMATLTGSSRISHAEVQKVIDSRVAQFESGGCSSLETLNTNLRELPTTESRIIITTPQGDIVPILEVLSGGWYRVNYNGQEGYMHHSAVKNIECDYTETNSVTIYTQNVYDNPETWSSVSSVVHAESGDRADLFRIPTAFSVYALGNLLGSNTPFGDNTPADYIVNYVITNLNSDFLPNFEVIIDDVSYTAVGVQIRDNNIGFIQICREIADSRSDEEKLEEIFLLKTSVNTGTLLNGQQIPNSFVGHAAYLILKRQ